MKHNGSGSEVAIVWNLRLHMELFDRVKRIGLKSLEAILVTAGCSGRVMIVTGVVHGGIYLAGGPAND